MFKRIARFIKCFKTCGSKENKEPHCPNCNERLKAAKPQDIKPTQDGGVYLYKCASCGEENKWDFNTLYPTLLEK